MLSDPLIKFQKYLQYLALDCDSYIAEKRRYSNACARLMREEFRLVVNNGPTVVKWENYGY